ncbi:MAG: radical SAM/SPASM domain-containing protein [Myxococcota bacterium]
MKRRAVLRSGVGAARYRLTGHRIPLSVHLTVTRRCDALCATCAVPLTRARELDTREWIGVIDALARAGTVRVGFGGGEPLVRDDLPVLIDRCAEHRMWTTLETNGHRYPARAGELGRLHRLVIALDGDRAAHDENREPGAYDKATAAIAVASERGTDLHTVTTLTRHNLGDVGHVLDLADRWGFVADFTPLGPLLPHAGARALAAPPDELRKALRGLLEAKLAGRRVGNTEKSLRYLLTWPDFAVSASTTPHEDLHCLAGQLYCAVDADGGVAPCPLLHGRFAARNVRGGGFAAAFEVLRDNACKACTSTPLAEYNYLYNLNGPAVFERCKSLLRAGPAGAA